MTILELAIEQIKLSQCAVKGIIVNVKDYNRMAKGKGVLRHMLRKK